MVNYVGFRNVSIVMLIFHYFLSIIENDEPSAFAASVVCETVILIRSWNIQVYVHRSSSCIAFYELPGRIEKPIPNEMKNFMKFRVVINSQRKLERFEHDVY